MRETDVVIAGGSFAGLCCAKAAAANGLNTVVLERKSNAGQAPHTTGILVKEVADEWDIPTRLTRRIDGVALYGPALERIDLQSPDYHFLATDTPELLRWLAREAQAAGAQIRYQHPYKAAYREADRIVLAGQGLRCRYLVGSDGARSRVAQHFGLGKNNAFLYGIEAELHGVQGLDEQRFHVFLDQELAPGYIGWAIPGVGITQIGLAVRRPHVPKLDAFIDKLSGLFDFSQSQRVGLRAGLIPCGGNVSPMSTDGVLLLGDAAGTVSPLTAGGIHPAMQLGQRAGLALADHLLAQGPDPAKVIRATMPSFRFKKLLRSGYDRMPWSNQLSDVLFATPAFRALAQTLFFHHRGLFSARAWRDILLAARR